MTENALVLDPVQTAGNPCAACGEKITFAGSALPCLACRTAFHTSCLARGRECPTCGDDLPYQEQRAEDQRSSEDERRLQEGRVQFLLGACIYGGLLVLELLVAYFMGIEEPSSGNPAVRLLVGLSLMVATSRGYGLARILLGLQLGFGILLGGLVLIWGDRPLALKLFGLSIPMASLWLLCVSPEVSFYFETRRTELRPR